MEGGGGWAVQYSGFLDSSSAAVMFCIRHVQKSKLEKTKSIMTHITAFRPCCLSGLKCARSHIGSSNSSVALSYHVFVEANQHQLQSPKGRPCTRSVINGSEIPFSRLIFHLSFNRGGRWVTTDGFATISLCSPLPSGTWRTPDLILLCNLIKTHSNLSPPAVGNCGRRN